VVRAADGKAERNSNKEREMSSRDIGANDADNAEDFELHRKPHRDGEPAANDDAGTEDFELHRKPHRDGEPAANDDAGTEDFELHMKATGGKTG
jgi:hypothetical protein